MNLSRCFLASSVWLKLSSHQSRTGNHVFHVQRAQTLGRNTRGSQKKGKTCAGVAKSIAEGCKIDCRGVQNRLLRVEKSIQ